jgi:type II secretory pathway pseudopilin PulG
MRRRGLRSAKLQITNQKSQIPQRGYMLITLMLALALITIGLLTVLPEIGQQIRRDREEEMRHRGTAYMRAIQHFYKKFGRYPMRVEELENTNNLRFLRKRYADPMSVDRATGKEKDFKLLHQQDITLNNGPVLGPTPGPQQPGISNTPPPLSLDPSNPSPGNPSPGNPSPGNPPDTVGNPDSAESSSSNSIAKSGFGAGLNGPVFGGGPILGVASTSKAKSIRVFYDKNHYNDWLFIYVPQADRGGLLTGPVSLNGPTGNLGIPPPPGPGMSPNPAQPQSAPTQSPQSPNPGPMPPEQ